MPRTDPAPVEIGPFAAEDRARWEVLARGYKTFYETTLPAEDYERAWQRLRKDETILGLGARIDGRLVGIAHYFFHPHVWTADFCYLQDLFVDEACRGRGAARALIMAVAERARAQGAPRLYWQTKESNARARALYDTVARFNGFIRYDIVLE